MPSAVTVVYQVGTISSVAYLLAVTVINENRENFIFIIMTEL
jgi:hypothetical protein